MLKKDTSGATISSTPLDQWIKNQGFFTGLKCIFSNLAISIKWQHSTEAVKLFSCCSTEEF
jgi:hypothetical protein